MAAAKPREAAAIAAVRKIEVIHDRNYAAGIAKGPAFVFTRRSPASPSVLLIAAPKAANPLVQVQGAHRG